MEKMKELYQKVASDAKLQAKFSDILGNAEKAGATETERRLIEFAKEAGYEVSIKEIQEFFRRLADEQNSELSESELDMVAGGKGGSIDWGKIIGGAIIATSVIAGASGAGAIVSVGCVVGAGTVEGAMS